MRKVRWSSRPVMGLPLASRRPAAGAGPADLRRVPAGLAAPVMTIALVSAALVIGR